MGNFYQILDEIIKNNWSKGDYYISEYIEKEKEFRIYIAFNRVVCVAEKHPKDKSDIAWNHSQGASFKNVKWSNWPLEACRMAINSAAIAGLDFGGADVIMDKSGNFFLLEVNSAPSLTSKYRQECFAKAFDWEITENFPTKPHSHLLVGPIIQSWKECIHPGVWNNE